MRWKNHPKNWFSIDIWMSFSKKSLNEPCWDSTFFADTINLSQLLPVLSLSLGEKVRRYNAGMIKEDCSNWDLDVIGANRWTAGVNSWKSEEKDASKVSLSNRDYTLARGPLWVLSFIGVRGQCDQRVCALDIVRKANFLLGSWVGIITH